MKSNLIGGEWVGSEQFTENRNPADQSDLIGQYCSATHNDVERAIGVAAEVSAAWGRTSPQIRTDLLDRVGTVLLARKDELGELLAREEGKTLAEATGEVARAAQIFKFFAGEAVRINGDAIDSTRPDIDVAVTREPVGVVGIITPWNFPIAIPAWKIAPALAYGNTVVFKPAGITPASAHMLAEIIHAAGCPAGVFNLVMGSGAKIGSAMVSNPAVSAISFTGSVSVGHSLAKDALQNMTKIQLEMGGKNPMVIMEDADLEIAIPAIINSAFYSTGQRCTATSRVIVEASIHDRFVERLVKETKALKVGNPLDATTQIGPVVSASQLKNNLEYIDIANQEGAEPIGGQQLDLGVEGYFQSPAIFLNASNAMRTSREEIFGPCLSVLKVSGFDEALAVSNDTEFGLSAGICTSSLKYAREFKRESQAGMVMVNLPTAGVDYHVPFGGRKGSSYGAREQGRYAADFYTAIKTSYCFAG